MQAIDSATLDVGDCEPETAPKDDDPHFVDWYEHDY